MEKKSAWMEASQDLYKNSNLFNTHGFFDSTTLASLAFAEDETPVHRSQKRSKPFYNINFFSSDLFDQEFLASPGAALYWQSQQSPVEGPLTYCQLGPQLSPAKQKLLQTSGQVDLGIDPFSLGLWKSLLFKNYISAQDILDCEMGRQRLFRLSGQAYAMAGASEIQQMAIVASSLVQIIEDYRDQVSAHEIMARLSFEICLKPHLTLSVAHCLAFRSLVERLFEIYEANQEATVFAVPSLRFLAAREPWNNLMRLTTINMAAIMGGANGMVQIPMDFLSGGQDTRLGRNMCEILKNESHLDKVTDPLKGSFSLEQIVNDFCESAWRFFCEIEKKGGVRETLRSGWLHDEINREHELQVDRFLKRQLKIVGVNQYALTESLSSDFPLPKKQDIKDIESWWCQQIDEEGSSKLCDVERLIPFSLSELTEQWQIRGDVMRTGGSDLTTVALVVEPGGQSAKKITMAKEILALGGLKVQVHSVNEISKIPVVALIAADPEGEFAKQFFKSLDKKQWPLWVGDKQLSQFKGHVGTSSHLPNLFRNIYDHLEAQK